jgi:hypothetical protein
LANITFERSAAYTFKKRFHADLLCFLPQFLDLGSEFMLFEFALSTGFNDSLPTTTNENIMSGRSYLLMAVNGQTKTIIGFMKILGRRA